MNKMKKYTKLTLEENNKQLDHIAKEIDKKRLREDKDRTLLLGSRRYEA